MNRNTIFMYIAVSLVMLVPVPGRLYYGVPVIIVLNLLMVLTTLFSKLMDHLKFCTSHQITAILLEWGITGKFPFCAFYRLIVKLFCL